MQTLYFFSRLPTRQDGFQNRDKSIAADILYIAVLISRVVLLSILALFWGRRAVISSRITCEIFRAIFSSSTLPKIAASRHLFALRLLSLFLPISIPFMSVVSISANVFQDWLLLPNHGELAAGFWKTSILNKQFSYGSWWILHLSFPAVRHCSFLQILWHATLKGDQATWS